MGWLLGWVLRIALLVIGALLLGLGTVAAVLVGPDDIAQTGPHRLSSKGAAIVTDPEVFAYVGPTLHLTVERADGGAVFVGLANEVDARSYLGDEAHLAVTDVRLPWTITTTERGTEDAGLAAPGDLTWWVAEVSGSGPQTLVWPIQNGRWMIVGTNADGSTGVQLDVTLGLELRGVFWATVAVAVVGLALLLVGLWLVLRRRWRRRERAAASDEVSEIGLPDGSEAGLADADAPATDLAAQPYAGPTPFDPAGPRP